MEMNDENIRTMARFVGLETNNEDKLVAFVKQCIAETVATGYIKLIPAEIQSRHTRVDWAEGLIRQLPPTHEGRNSWLLNYAKKD